MISGKRASRSRNCEKLKTSVYSMTFQNLKEEIIKQFDEKFAEIYEVADNRRLNFLNSEMKEFFVSALLKAAQAGAEAGRIRDTEEYIYRNQNESIGEQSRQLKEFFGEK